MSYTFKPNMKGELSFRHALSWSLSWRRHSYLLSDIIIARTGWFLLTIIIRPGRLITDFMVAQGLNCVANGGPRIFLSGSSMMSSVIVQEQARRGHSAALHLTLLAQQQYSYAGCLGRTPYSLLGMAIWNFFVLVHLKRSLSSGLSLLAPYYIYPRGFAEEGIDLDMIVVSPYQ